MEKSCGKLARKASPNPFLILVNNPKQLLHAINYFKNKMFWKRVIKRPLKKLTLYFLLNPVHFNGQEQKGPETSDQSFSRLRGKFRNIPLLVMYCLTKFHDEYKAV